MKTPQHHTSFTYTRSLTTDGRIILVDEPLSPGVQGELKKLKTTDDQDLLFLDDKELAAGLEEILRSITEKEQDILLVFPGNGSNYPRKLSRVCKEFPSASVYAKRIWEPGADPVVTAGVILPEIFLVMTVGTIVVVDDVISSGLTLRKVHQNNAWRFTRAKWIGASWVSQVPRMKAKSGVNGYEYVATACVVGRTDGGRVPINSVSTLRQQPEIAESYAYRHFEEPEVFLRLVCQ